MPIGDLRQLVSDGCTVLPSIADSPDVIDGMHALMITVAVSVLFERLTTDGRHEEALAVLAGYGGTA